MLDPDDKYESKKNGAKYLQYKKLAKGSLLMKHRDQAENFYINLSGKIGIFVEKTAEDYKNDLMAIEWIKNKMKRTFHIK